MIYRCCTKQSYWENTNFNKPKKLGIYQPHVVIFNIVFGRSGNIWNIIQVVLVFNCGPSTVEFSPTHDGHYSGHAGRTHTHKWIQNGHTQRSMVVASNNFWSDSLEIFLLTSPFQQDPQRNETTYHNHS